MSKEIGTKYRRRVKTSVAWSRRALMSALGVAVFSAAFDALGAKQRKKAADDDSPQVTYMGFRSGQNGRSIIFVELTAPVPVEMAKAPSAVVFTLKGGKVLGKTNRYPLLMSEFDSPVVSAQLVQEQEGVKLVIKLRKDITPAHRLNEVRGGAVLEVEFSNAR